MSALPDRLFIYDGLAGYDASRENNGNGTAYYRGDILDKLFLMLRRMSLSGCVDCGGGFSFNTNDDWERFGKIFESLTLKPEGFQTIQAIKELTGERGN